MEITKLFTNDIEQIERGINNIPVENCLEKFEKYIYYDEKNISLSITEKQYIKLLRDDLCNFVIHIYMKAHLNKSNDELLSIIMDKYKYGEYCVADDLQDRSLVDIFYGYNDKDLHEDIVQYMITKLEELKANINQTKKESEIQKLVKDISLNETAIKNYSLQLEKDVEKLKAIKGEI